MRLPPSLSKASSSRRISRPASLGAQRAAALLQAAPAPAASPRGAIGGRGAGSGSPSQSRASSRSQASAGPAPRLPTSAQAAWSAGSASRDQVARARASSWMARACSRRCGPAPESRPPAVGARPEADPAPARASSRTFCGAAAPALSGSATTAQAVSAEFSAELSAGPSMTSGPSGQAAPSGQPASPGPSGKRVGASVRSVGVTGALLSCAGPARRRGRRQWEPVWRPDRPGSRPGGELGPRRAA